MPPRETTGGDGETGDAQVSSQRGDESRKQQLDAARQSAPSDGILAGTPP